MFVEREDVAARARRERRSTENAARIARHAFFERARIHFGADFFIAFRHRQRSIVDVRISMFCLSVFGIIRVVLMRPMGDFAQIKL